jgi:hypothetical protein
MKINLSPIRILIYYLTILMVVGSFSQAGTSYTLWFVQFRNFVLLLGGGYAVYRLLLLTKKITPTRFEHRYITSAILLLLFYIDYPWYLFLGLGVGAEVLQRFIRVPTGPLMNPAALVTMVAAYLKFYPLWWGASFAPRIPILSDGVSIAVFLTVPFGVYVAYKYRKLKIVGAFMLAFLIAFVLILRRSPLFNLLEGTLFFFALVMAIEPKTSPVLLKEQLLYGVALGVLIPLAIKFHFVEPYSGPLILSNLIFNLYRNRNWLRKKFQPTKRLANATIKT